MGEEGAPAWMVSFGDMMTLILTFFILLVSMADTQNAGLVATGVGSFLVQTRSFGLPGILNDYEEAQIFETVRSRFNLPPESDPNRKADHTDASNLEQIRAAAANHLKPHRQVAQPGVANFEPGSSTLTEASKRYIDLLAPVLFPAVGQTLLLEGHAPDNDKQLAFARANAVALYLVERHQFPKPRLKPRCWFTEIDDSKVHLRSVDARLIIPAKDD